MKKLPIKSQNFKFLQKSYGEWLGIRGYAKNTVKVYPLSLQEFFHFLEQKNIVHLNKIESRHAYQFKLHLQYRTNQTGRSGGISNQTINSILTGINLFETFINESKEINQIDIHQDYLTIDTAEKQVLTQQEIKDLYMATFEDYPNRFGSREMGQRDRVILAVFYGCGLRKSEGINLNISDVDFQNRRLLVRKGKGNKQRYVPIPNQHLEDIKTYIEQGRYWFTEHHHQVNLCYKRSFKKEVTKDDQEALIISNEGKRMKSFTYRLNYLKDIAGVNTDFSLHQLRHSLATHLLQNGVELEQISKMLGHVSIDTTQIYTHIVEKLKNKENEY